MGTMIAAIVLIGSAGAFAWLVLGPIGQRGRAIRAERAGKPNEPFVASMIMIVVLVAVFVVSRNH